MNSELLEALNVLEKEKNISKDTLLEAIEQSLLQACKNHFGKADNVKVFIDPVTCEFNVHAEKTVVEKVEDPIMEISLENAKQLNSKYELGDIVNVEIKSKEFGRIATMNAKNVILQKIREEERKVLFEEYYQKEKDIITGIVQRYVGRNVSVNLGKVDTVLMENEMVKGEVFRPTERIKLYVLEVKDTPKGPKVVVSRTHPELVKRLFESEVTEVKDGTVEIKRENEMVKGEVFRPTERIKLYVLEVKDTPKGPKVVVSRTHPELVKRLFESEVTEVKDGTVEIKSIAREAGSRTKMAVWSNNPDVDPVGACVGMNGVRVNTIVEELRGEKIDIINWDENPAILIENALSPAKVISVIADDDEKTAKVIVPDYQLSLAIGKEGQNARLAAKLTGFKIDIKSETQVRESGELDEYLMQGDYEEDADTEAADEDTFDYEEAYEETSDKETEDMLNEEGDQE